MARAHLTLIATLLIAATAADLSAQTPTDSAATDSAAPKKKGRFGGLVDKAKKVAGNKAVQDAAKGAATGVACTVVPGAAVVSAATGQGPCATSGLMGTLMSGGAKDAVTAGAANMGQGLAAGAAAKAIGKGGVSGAAAAGALGAVGGASGLASAAAQAAALKAMGSRGGAAAAQAAALKAMGYGGGVTNAAAQAAALKAMGGANGMAAAQAAMLQAMGAAGGANNAAAQAAMLQAMGAAGGANNAAAQAAAMAAAARMMSDGGGTPAANTGKTAGGAAAAASPALWVNYDFVPGDRVIFYSDFTDDQVGNFPARLEFIEGNMEVAELGGRRLLRATSQSLLSIPLPEVLPEKFTIEIDVINRPSLAGTAFHLRGNVGRVDDRATSLVSWGSDGVSLLGGGGGEVKVSNNDANRVRYSGKPAQLRVIGDGKYVKVYLDERRLANVPNANFTRSRVLHLIIDARSDENPAYIGRIRVAESRKLLYEELASKGRVATQGILFDTGSERVRPESTPTLKQIA
ncbi:MAG: hypothetical protein H0T48_00530, partial [Gemmatimonadaceae bacterium]|nr:hypothetical protein [Gemmatimonadaceae bacterium]